MRKHVTLVAAALVIGLSGYAHAISWGQHTTIQGYYSDTNANIVLTTANNQNRDACSSSLYLVIQLQRFKLQSGLRSAHDGAGYCVDRHIALQRVLGRVPAHQQRCSASELVALKSFNEL
jgi:hypothetical protein